MKEAISKGKKEAVKDGKKGGFKGKTGAEKKPFEKKPFEKKSFDKKPFDKKPFDKNAKPANGESKTKAAGEKNVFKASGSKDGAKAEGGPKKDFKKFKPKPKVKRPMTPEERKMAKPHYKLVEGLKVNWNKVRDRGTDGDVRSSTLVKMVDQVKDHILAVTLRHDASRIVQTVLQFGTPAQKETILHALCAKTYEIAKTPYGHFTVLKAVTYCTRPEDQRKLAASLKGHFVSLGGNVIGSRTVESVLQLYPTNLTKGLKAEFYGQVRKLPFLGNVSFRCIYHYHFFLLQKFCILAPEVPRNLRSLIEQLPNKQSAIMDHMRDLVQKFVQKGLLEFAYVHNLLWEYTQEALTDSNAHRMQDLVNQLAESAPKLLSTKPGTKVMCAVITHAAAKDRKRIIKTLKGHVLESLLHDSAYLGIMRLVDVTDDTVNVQKSLFDELKSVTAAAKYTASGELIQGALPPLVAIALHRNGHRLLLRLLSPAQRHLEPDDEVLFATAGENSKKTPELRRREHLVYLRTALVQLGSIYTEQLMRSRSGSRVLEALIAVYHPHSVVEAVARVCAGVQAAEIEVAEEEEEDYEEEEGDEEEYDEEEEGDYDETDEYAEEEGEEEEGDEGDDEGDEEVEVDEEVLQDMEEDLQADKAAAKKKGAESATVAAVEEKDLLPIQEDPVVHQFLKRVLQFEQAVELKQELVAGKAKTLLKSADFQKLVTSAKDEKNTKDSVVVDDSLWVDKYDVSESAEAPSSVAHRLVTLLSENEELFGTWLSQNRPCFALVKVFSLPTLVAQLNKGLNKAQLAALKSSADKHEGGKILLQLHDLVKRSK